MIVTSRAALNACRLGTPVAEYRPAFQSSVLDTPGLTCLVCMAFRLDGYACSCTRMSAPRQGESQDPSSPGASPLGAGGGVHDSLRKLRSCSLLSRRDAARAGDLPDLPVGLAQEVQLTVGIPAEPEVHPLAAGQIRHGDNLSGV